MLRALAAAYRQGLVWYEMGMGSRHGHGAPKEGLIYTNINKNQRLLLHSSFENDQTVSKNQMRKSDLISACDD